MTATAALWPPIRTADGWVHRIARLLDPARGVAAATVQAAVGAVLAAMADRQADAGALAPAVTHFLKVTRSSWPGLFHCSDIADLPRPTNDLEQLFGAVRYRERRATGRTRGTPSLVVRGAVRLIAAVTTPTQGWRPASVRPPDLGAWRQRRRELEQRQAARRAQHRFRRDPAAYLTAAEVLLLKASLPP